MDDPTVNPLSVLRRWNGWPDFTGKVIAVYVRSSQGGGGVYGDVRIERLGFRSFLVGRYVSQEPWQEDRWSNVIGWVAVEDITKILVFDDVDAVRRAFASDEP